jgi:hypothetical protein
VVASRVGLPPDRWVFPLVDARDRFWVGAESLGRRIWSSPASTPLTVALSRAGVPVVQIAEYAKPIFASLRELLGASAIDVAAEYALVTPVAMSPSDHVLVDTIQKIFDACHRGPPRVILARVQGVHDDLLAIAGGPDDAAFAAHAESYVLARDVVASTPFTRTRRRAVVLNVGHRIVQMARNADDARMAASHLARGVLLQHRILDVDKSAAILSYTITNITRGPT